MNDIAERLRHEAKLSFPPWRVLNEAADEIERLTSERDFALAAHEGQVQDKEYIARELVKMRTALKEVRQFVQDAGGDECPEAQHRAGLLLSEIDELLNRG